MSVRVPCIVHSWVALPGSAWLSVAGVVVLVAWIVTGELVCVDVSMLSGKLHSGL